MKKSWIFFPLCFAIIALFNSCDKDDSECTNIWYQDSDGDGLGNPDESQQACDQPTGYVANSSDTDDTVDDSVIGEVTAYGDALSAQILAGDGSGIDNSFRNSGVVVNETTNTYFAVNGVHPVNSGDYSSYYPKSIVEASLETDEIVNVWSFDSNTLGRQVDMEALSFANNTDYLYIGDEYNYIYELDLATGLITREWNLADIGISTSTDRGIEALAFYDGYFYAGIQEEQQIYQLDLNLDASNSSDAGFQEVEEISSFSVNNSPSGLFAASDGTFYMVAFGGGSVNQNIYNYSATGTLICTATISSDVEIQQADGIFIDANQEFVYIADSQGDSNGLFQMYKIPWSSLDCQ